MPRRKKSGDIVVRFEGRMTVDRAAEQHRVLCAALAEGLPLRVDVSEVSDIDAAGLQLLIAARRKCDAAGLGFSLKSPTAPILEAIELLGLQGSLSGAGA